MEAKFRLAVYVLSFLTLSSAAIIDVKLLGNMTTEWERDIMPSLISEVSHSQ